MAKTSWRTYFTGIDQLLTADIPSIPTNKSGVRMVLKGGVMTGILVTDNAHVNGSIVITANASWDLNGLGPVYGKFVLTPDEDLGTWEGTWEGKVTETGGCWKEDAVGRGGYNGMHLKMTEVYNPVTYTGELTGYIDE